jgi:uncharacterized membrane protein
MNNQKYLFITPLIFIVAGFIGHAVNFDVLALYPGTYLFTWLYIILFGVFVGWVSRPLFRNSNKLSTVTGLVGIALYIRWIFTPSGYAFKDTFDYMVAVLGQGLGLGYLPLPNNIFIHIEYIIVFLIFFTIAKIIQKLIRASKSKKYS